MQNKGFVKFIAAALTLICLFYFSFSFVTRHYNQEAEKIGLAAMAKATDKSRAQQDSAIAARAYLDSMMNEKVYLWKTLKDCQSLQIGLGLDLEGGMNVILEVSLPDVVKSLAGESAEDPAVLAAIQTAQKGQKAGDGDFVELFVKAYQEKNGQGKLGGIFATNLKDNGITYSSSDDDVRSALNKQVEMAVANSNEVVRTRIDRFGVAQPNIQILKGRGQVGQIMVEMPGIKEPERVRKLLQGSANLELWHTYRLKEVSQALNDLDARYAQFLKGETVVADTAATATAEGDSAVQAAPAAKKEEAAGDASHPLYSVLIQGQVVSPDYCIVGVARAVDTAAVNAIINSEVARQILPKDLRLYWGVKPSDRLGNNMFELYALHANEKGEPTMQGEVIANAKDDFDQYHRPIVSMQMTTSGSREWAQMTKKAFNEDKRQVAIVLDGYVYSAPNVQGEINGGNTQISGSFTTDDTRDLATVLNSGKMPAPTKIVQEETVGPSLGEASIRAGFTASIVAFVLLMIYMCLTYGFIPGMVANGALILNFFFTFGILISYQAALTMSGIAGMVLSLGMAVDANVLIFERTKEELRAGKNIKTALSEGYSNAFSAIFDSNLTSIITALILYNFGTGPIRGFALTTGIGIVCSFFTAVWLTRIVFEHFMNRDKWLGITFTTKLFKDFLTNTKVKFMEMSQKTFVIYACLAIVFVGFLVGRGLSRGIDFKGGRNFVIEFEQKGIDRQVVEDVVDAKVKAADPTASATALSIVTTNNEAVRISTTYKIDNDDESIDQEIEQLIWSALHEANLIKADYNTFKDRDNHTGGSIVSAQKVGPSVAADMVRGAIISVALAIVAIFLYILFRFRNVAFSIGSIGALILDTLFIIGMYAVCWGWMPFSMEVDQTFIGAVLTAIGYSINDKVVIFDRVREFLKLYPTRPTRQLFNDSLNSTLTRTITTSTTTMLVLLCIFFLGGDSIRSFSFAMILGVIFGTLSSIFLAAPIAYRLLNRKRIVASADEK